MTPSLPPGRGVGGTCAASDADGVPVFRDRIRAVFCLIWPSGGPLRADHAECVALHHPKPRDEGPEQKLRSMFTARWPTVPLDVATKSSRKAPEAVRSARQLVC